MAENQPNIWQANGIPALEYCKLDRASRLLGCEVEDLIHWFEVGAIDLCVRFYGNEKMEMFLTSTFKEAKMVYEDIQCGAGYIRFSPYSNVKIDLSDVENVNYESHDEDTISRFKYTCIPDRLWCVTGLRAVSKDYKKIGGRLAPYFGGEDVELVGDYKKLSFYFKEIRDFSIDYAGVGIDTEQFNIENLWMPKPEIEKIINAIGGSVPNYINGGVQPTEGISDVSNGKKFGRSADIIYLLAKTHPELGDGFLNAKVRDRPELLAQLAARHSLEFEEVGKDTIDRLLKSSKK